jgi:hypothetical protein
LTASDRRIQTVFTLDTGRPARLGAGTVEFLASLDATVMPWSEAVRERFDLVIAASENDDLHEFDAPVLLVPHGLGHQKYYPGTATVSGLDRRRAATATFALAHPAQARHLAEARPQAAARVVGDPALGRMLASSHRASQYRQALGAHGRTVLVLASTWGPDSLLGQWPDLPDRLLAELPHDEYQVVIVLHPGAWSAHSPWQIRAWFATAGVRLVPPEDGWQAALLGAQCVVADHGSLAVYAAALSRPLLLAPRPSSTTVPRSASAALAEQAPRLDPRRPLRAQIEAAGPRVVSDDAVHSPGTAAARLRELLYEMLHLREPPLSAAFTPVPVPPPDTTSAAVLIAGAEAGPPAASCPRGDADEVAVARFVPSTAPVSAGLAGQHVVADVDRAGLDALGAATVLLVGDVDRAGADRLLAEWPRAALIADADRDGCRVWTRDAAVRLRGPLEGVDPAVLASFAYLRLRSDGALPQRGVLRIGDRVIAVAAD